MNHKIITAGLLLLGGQAAAQQATPLQVSWFEADHARYFQVKGALPHSDVSFYSQPGGGQLLKKVTTNSQGRYTLTSTDEVLPAFILNDGQNDKGIAGSGMVVHLPGALFTLKDVTAEQQSNAITIRWEARTAHAAAVAFELTRSTGNGPYKRVAIIPATQQSDDWTPYTFTDQTAAGTAASYQLNVLYENETSYTTTVRKSQSQNTGSLRVYPTTTRADVSVDIARDEEQYSYRILNAYGQSLGTGKLEPGNNRVSFQQLPAGNYFIHVLSNKERQVFKIIKL